MDESGRPDASRSGRASDALRAWLERLFLRLAAADPTIEWDGPVRLELLSGHWRDARDKARVPRPDTPSQPH